jgi:hypothetical protein
MSPSAAAAAVAEIFQNFLFFGGGGLEGFNFFVLRVAAKQFVASFSLPTAAG